MILSLMLIACGAKQNNSTDKNNDEGTTVINDGSIPAWQRYAKEDPVTLDWYVNYSWFVTGWGNNLVSQKITEETGVSINFITPKGNEEEKLNALISSNSLPDIITLGWWEPQFNAMINNGMVYSFNELADKYDMYFYDICDNAVVDWYTYDDGNLYCYPCSSCAPQDLEKHDNIASNQTFLVRKDIYEAIGSPDMSTPQGFMDAVRKAQEMFPTVNGQPLIPIGAHVFDDTGNTSFDKYLMNFLAVPYEKDGKLYDRYTDEEFLTWLKAYRQLAEEGYLKDCIFVDNRTQMSEKIEEGRYFCMLYQRTDLADQQKILYSKDPNSVYMAVDGPRNSKGDDPTLPTSTINGWTVTLISKNCKNPDRTIAFIDYLISEHGQKMVSLGVEGETYDIIDGKYVIRPEVQKLLDTDRMAYDEMYGASDAYWMLQDNVMQMEWMPQTEECLRQMEEWTYPYTMYNGQYEVSFNENTPEGVARNKIDRLWGRTLPKLLLADNEEIFDEIVSDFIAERESYGYSVLLDAENKQMLDNKRRLGMEE